MSSVRFSSDQQQTMVLVLDHVPPDNIGALPTSSETLLSKARQPGLAVTHRSPTPERAAMTSNHVAVIVQQGACNPVPLIRALH
ncbi:hypothetical protein [Pseudomonas sp. GL-B-26]|uniref:hypothetical protein n=1 Tax=Pseudomonas sp. GL-B-26 TaxID=2832394 RepID=UPI001CBC5037|nr:hypothetical protein [Pseudomonas sp. GL-B-26]